MNYADTEKTLDLKLLLFFILKRWKSIFLFLIIGALLGTGFALVRGKPSVEEMDTSDLNMERIIQYAHYQDLYHQQLETEKTSVLLQMNPNEVYLTFRTFFLTVPAQQAELIRQKYSVLMTDVELLKELIEVSGLECNEHAIKELAGVYMSVIEPTTLWGQSGFAPANAKLTINVYAPNEETGNAMIQFLGEKVDVLNEQLKAQFSGFSVEPLADTHQFGYEAGVSNAQSEAAELLQDYSEVLTELEKQMSDEDLDYYSAAYSATVDAQKELLSQIKRIVKYAVVFGALFSILIVGCYGLQFLLDDHIKTAHEVHEYGLYTIACLQSTEKKKSWIDKLFSDDNLPSNSREYLLNALKAVSDGKLVLSGDLNDSEIAETMKWLSSQMDNLCVTDRMACAEQGLLTAKESEGAVLFIRLWKSTTFDLKRELYVLRQIEKPVKGVVVLRG